VLQATWPSCFLGCAPAKRLREYRGNEAAVFMIDSFICKYPDPRKRRLYRPVYSIARAQVMRRRCVILLIAALCCAAESLAQVGGCIDADVSRPASVDAPRTTEAAFGPEAGAEALIIKVIATANISIRLAGFAFSSPVIVAELISAKKRGVDVQVVVDRRHNVDEDEKGIGRKALSLLAKSHVAIRTNSNYRILHDKFLIVDARHVQTGSYNYAS
jgi:phosphatidylserine/phosphatidylglycerophosphate/cardiolipin synthase-like enzyme